MQLRSYQTEAVDKIRAALMAGRKRPLVVLPTGAGKSLVYASIIDLALQKGKKSLFLVHRRNLVKQFAKTLEDFYWITAGVIMAGEEFVDGLDVYVSTVQTYHRRMQLDVPSLNKFFIDADIILTDEAHTTISKRYKDIFKAYSSKVIIGTTATPVRADGRGLGEVYDDIICPVDVEKLIADGFLCPVRYFAPADVDLSKIQIKLGDYDEKQLDKKINTPKLVGDVVENWLRLAENRKTIVFAVNVKHSINLRDEFLKHGIQAIHLDAHSTDDEREDAFKAMDDGRVQVICNVALYIEGMDVPDIQAVVMARPTKSIGLYRQCVGRGLRIAKGKDDLVLIDHAGVIAEHGYITDEIEWSLDSEEKGWRKSKAKEKEKKPMKCPSCHSVVEGVSTCPTCGSEMRRFGKPVETVDGDLVEMKGRKNYTMADKRRWFGMCVYYQRQKGYSDGWTSHKYKEKIGVWPRGMADVMPIQPDQMFYNFIRHLQIKHAKSKQSVAIVNGP